jgi:hypothetical protein
VPRLFHSNLFNIATNDLTLMYGATGSPSEHWARWRDPWPKAAADFTDETEKGLYALLEPARLLDILAHYIVFETREGKTVKKLCRYQQLRAVNKMVARVVEGKHRAGLVWHTQGSGKSLTMVWLAKWIRENVTDARVLIVTDRTELDQEHLRVGGRPAPQPGQEGMRGLDQQQVPDDARQGAVGEGPQGQQVFQGNLQGRDERGSDAAVLRPPVRPLGRLRGRAHEGTHCPQQDQEHRLAEHRCPRDSGQ